MPRQRPDQPKLRFEATVHCESADAARQIVADLDLDRLPDPTGTVRVLLTPEEAARLLDRGFEVRLAKAYPVRPLDKSLVLDDKAARTALEDRVRGLPRQGER